MQEILSKLSQFVNLYNLPYMFLVDEYCLANYFGKKYPYNKLEVVSAFDEHLELYASLFATEIAGKEIHVFDDLIKVEVDEYTIEFQSYSTKSYMKNQDIISYLEGRHIDKVPLLNNICGRDFTIETIVLSIKQRKFYDTLNLGMRDLEKQLIKSILPPELLIKHNPFAMLKALRLSVFYDLYIDAELFKIIHDQLPNIHNYVSKNTFMEEIMLILRHDPQKGLDLIKKFDLDKLFLKEDQEIIEEFADQHA